MSGNYRNCTHVTPACPVAATTYGYEPNLAGNAVLLAVFAACNIVQLLLGLKYRLWSFGSVVSIACFLEWVGYVGRLLLHNNAWDSSGFRIQIICLIIAPSFLAAGIYLTLKHMVMALGPEYSRLRPRLYTWIFITFDAFSIVVQAVGGGVAASGTKAQLGGNIMIAGIAIQVVTMGICILLAADFGWTLYNARRRGIANVHPHSTEKPYSTSTSFCFYLGLTSLAFLTIFIRCIYRLPEMAGGWGNPLMRNEKEFLVLDGGMIAIACVLMTIAHPGLFFPDMRAKRSR